MGLVDIIMGPVDGLDGAGGYYYGAGGRKMGLVDMGPVDVLCVY